MAHIIRSPIWPDPRAKPPFGAARVNWAHPLARDMSTCLLFNEGGGKPQSPARETQGAGWSITGAVWRTGPGGKQLSFDNTSKFVSYDTNNFPFGSLVTVSAVVIPDLVNSAVHSVFRDSTTTAIYLWSTNVWAGYSSPSNEILGTSTVVAGTTYRVTLVLTPAGRALYVNHAQERADVGTATSGSGAIKIGSDDFSQHWSGGIISWCKWNRALSAADVAWLYNEPYSFLRPAIRRRYFVPAAGGATWPGWMWNKGGWTA